MKKATKELTTNQAQDRDLRGGNQLQGLPYDLQSINLLGRYVGRCARTVNSPNSTATNPKGSSRDGMRAFEEEVSLHPKQRKWETYKLGTLEKERRKGRLESKRGALNCARSRQVKG